MRYALLCLLLAFAWPIEAQEIEVYRPDGTHARYIPQRPLVKHVHDTLETHDTIATEVHRIDTLQIIERTVVDKPTYIQTTVIVRDTAIVRNEQRSQLGVFGFSTFRANLIGPAYTFRLGPIQFFLTVGVTYLSDYEKRQVTPNAGVAAFGGF